MITQLNAVVEKIERVKYRVTRKSNYDALPTDNSTEFIVSHVVVATVKTLQEAENVMLTSRMTNPAESNTHSIWKITETEERLV
jgi:hypothetical protein